MGGHLLVAAALNTLLSEMCFHIPDLSPNQQHVVGEPVSADAANVASTMLHKGQTTVLDDLTTATTVFQELMSSTGQDIVTPFLEAIHRLTAMVEILKSSLTEYPTAQLWFQYLNMVDLLCKFLRSERTGNWNLHVQVLCDMLPYMAAAGHSLYTKSVYIYLQRMSQLPEASWIVFSEGLHVVRRSDKFWAGLSTDLFIEQVLMRSLKTSGGLTRGRGMFETQRTTWLFSRPSCSAVNVAMHEFTGVHFVTSDQHKDMSKARHERDVMDTDKLIDFLSSHQPFSTASTLHGIDTGVCAAAGVNANIAVCVGNKILASMEGQNVLKYVFKKIDQVITMDRTSQVRVGRSQSVDIDPQLLFQRLVTAGSNCGELHEVFKYELCSYPPALFHSVDTLLETDKPALANAMWKLISNHDVDVPEEVAHVLDGAALLHRIYWETGKSWQDIATQVYCYVLSKYRNVSIVFDGYESGPTTKQWIQKRRARGAMSPTHILCGISKVPFEIPHKISYPYIERYDFYAILKF